MNLAATTMAGVSEIRSVQMLLTKTKTLPTLKVKSVAFLIHIFLYRGPKSEHQKVKLPPIFLPMCTATTVVEVVTLLRRSFFRR
jgi:hypothetical protein